MESHVPYGLGLGRGWQGPIGSELRNEGREQGKSVANTGFDRRKEFEKMARGRSHLREREKQKHSWRGQLVEGPPGVRGAGVGHT